MTSDLVQWLNSQLDEDEGIALAASSWLKPAAYWSVDEWFGREQPHSLIAQGSSRLPVVGGHFTADPVPTVQAEHIVRHDPARVLREVEAKRRLLYQFEHRGNSVRATAGLWDGGVWDDMLRLLALPYADRPGYREEWRP